MKPRMIINLIAFLAITVALVGYGLFDLLGNPLQHPALVSATFPDASGIEPNFGVVLDGVVVGSVSDVKLTQKGAVVHIALRPDTKVPANVVASIGLANDLGEQQVQLQPTGKSTGAFLKNGSVLKVQPGGIPVQVGKVIGTASRLLKSIGVHQLNSLLATLSQGLSGEGANLQTIMTAGQQFSAEFLAFQHQFEALLANSTPVLNGVASEGPQLRQAIARTAVLADVLDHHRYNLISLLKNGADASQLADQLLNTNEPNFACILHDFADFSANGAQPQNLSNLSVGLATNTWFFGAVAAISPTGPAKSLFPGDAYNANQEWLRTRLFLPPGNPPASQYPQATGLNSVLPGAACKTEFGNGVGPASQNAAQFPVTGTRTVPPSASDAQVRGGGDPAVHSGQKGASALGPNRLTAFDAPATSSGPAGPGGWLVLGLAVIGGLALMLPSRRRYTRSGGGAPRPTRAARARSALARLSSPDRKERP